MRARSLFVPAIAALSLVSLSLTATVSTARAQTTASTSVDFQNTDVREALRFMFKESNRSFTISPAVQGVVTLSLRNVPFDAALANVARQVDATYRVESGVYAIVPQDQGAGPAQGGLGGGGLGGGGFQGGGIGGGGGQGGLGGGFGGGGGFQGGFPGAGGQGTLFQGAGEPPAMVVDGAYLFVLRRGTVYKIDKKDMKVVGEVSLGNGGPNRPGIGGGGLGGGGLGRGGAGRP